MGDPQRAVRTYLDHLSVERGLAANTLASYRRDLRRYLGYLDGVGIADLDQVTEATVTEFLVRLREGDADHPPLSSTSAARTVVAVRGFHKFAVADGLTVADPASGVKPPAPAKRLPKALPLAEVEAILDAAGSPGTTLALRDRGRRPRRALPQRPRRSAVPSVRVGGAGQGRRPGRGHQGRLPAHAAALLRHPPPRRGRRRARRAGA